MTPNTNFEGGPRARQLRAAVGVSRKSQLVTVDGRQIAIEEIAPAPQRSPTIVCLHHSGGGSREFSPLRVFRPAGSRILLMDWPGHGRSDNCGHWSEESAGPPAAQPSPCGETGFSLKYSVHILHQALNWLGIRRPILLGSGFGAAVAIRYAADHPYRPTGLVLCQPAGLISSDALHPLSRPLQTLRRGLERLLPASSPLEMSLGAAWQSRRTAAVSRVMRQTILQAEASLQHSGASLKAALRAVRCPVLFALSRNHRQYPAWRYMPLLEPLIEAVPKHRFTVFQGQYHPLWDEPERFVRALNGFIEAQSPLEHHKHAWLLTAVDWPADNTNLWKCVHPECREEKILPAGQNPNQS